MLKHLRISGLWKWYGKTEFSHFFEESLTACFLVASRLADDLNSDDRFAEESSPSSPKLRNCWSSRPVKNKT